MSYDYQKEKAKLFTEEGAKKLIKIRDAALKTVALSGAFRYQEFKTNTHGVSGQDDWTVLAVLDYMVEHGELKKIASEVAGQYHLYVSKY